MASFDVFDIDGRASFAVRKSRRGKSLKTKAKIIIMETLLNDNNNQFEMTLQSLLNGNIMRPAYIALYMEIMKLVYPKWKKKHPKNYYENLEDAYYDYSRLTPNEKQNVRRRARDLDYSEYNDTPMITD